MKTLGKYFVSRRVIVYEMISFVFVLLTIWLDEILDIPYRFLGAEETPVNYKEAVFESIIIGLICCLVMFITSRLFGRMKYLEGLLPVCSSCKRIRDNKDEWHEIEAYIGKRLEVEFTHGICPDCAAKLYPKAVFPKK